ncbi:recombinase family protein [Corynebacterium glyciniphilum]|uniref:recombinase family protein n=1 Tax=Corynebacterium glyciniphilum TaxID=1404244 RepID=UPI003FD557AF
MGTEGTTDTGNAQVRTAIYCRISLDKRGEGLGVERQEAECRELAERNGWTVTKVYVDNSVSAMSTAKRPGYAAMLKAIKAEQFDKVVVWDADRLHRRNVELEPYIDVTERVGVDTHVVTAGHYDLSTVSGRMTARIIGAVAQQESEHKAERIRAAQFQARQSGKPRTDGRRALGYRFEGSQWVIVEREAEALRDAAAKLLAGVTLRQIARYMRAAGINTTRGNPMTAESIRDTLKQPRLAGLVGWTPKNRKGQRLRRNMTVLDGVVGDWEPILDVDTWHAVYDLLNSPDRRTNKRGNEVVNLGSNLYKCACGDDMGAKYRKLADGTKYRRYYCRRRLHLDNGRGLHSACHADELDAYVTETLLARLERIDIRAHLALSGGTADEVATLNGRRGTLRARLDDLDTAVGSGTLSMERYLAVAPKVEAQIAEVDDQLAALAGADNALTPLADTDDIRGWWETAPIDLRRGVLDALVTVHIERGLPGRTRFDPDRITFEWKSPAGE